jgi:hypothetical protein
MQSLVSELSQVLLSRYSAWAQGLLYLLTLIDALMFCNNYIYNVKHVCQVDLYFIIRGHLFMFADSGT